MKLNYLLFICFFLCFSVEFDFSIITDSEGVRQIFLGFLLLLTFLFYSKKNILPRSSLSTPKWMIIYLIVTILSIAWAVKPEEAPSACFGILICIYFSLMVAKKAPYEEIIKSFFNVSIFVVILSWMAFVLFRSYALNKEDFFRFKGIFVHAQRISAIISVALIFLFVNKRIVNGKSKRIMLFLLLFGTLVFTKTRANTTFLFGLWFLYYIESKKRYYLLVPLGILFLFGFYLNLTESVSDLYVRKGQSVTELTGRTMLWAKIIPLIKKKWLLGYGFGIFKTRPVAAFSWAPTHAHNLWLMQLYETGLVGMLAFQFFLIASIRTAFRHQKLFGFSYLKYTIYFIILSSITGLVLGGLVTPLYFILLICTFAEESRIRNYKTINASKIHDQQQQLQYQV